MSAKIRLVVVDAELPEGELSQVVETFRQVLVQGNGQALPAPVVPEAPAALPAPRRKKPTSRKGKTRKRTSETPTPARGKTSTDWAKGERMWARGDSVAAIATALSISEAAVYDRKKRYTWPSRGKTSAQKIPLTTCPNCEKVTSLDPCEVCHTKLPTGVIGTIGKA